MADAIRAGFERDCASLPIDANLVRQLRLYQTGFVNKNQDHQVFFGGHLLGVQVVRFTPNDLQAWFDDILHVDEETIFETHHKNPVLNGANGIYHVAGDPMNLSCAWLLHKLHSNPKMSFEVRRQAMIDVLLIMQYKFLTSRLYRLFRYPADREVAEAAYAQLNNKYKIKELGSWLAVLQERAEDIVKPNSIHYDAIAKMDDDRKVVYLINDTQGRIREMLKNIYDIFLKTHAAGERVSATSAVAEFDGVEAIRDQTNGMEIYKRYLRSVVVDKNAFIRPELLKVVGALTESAREKHVVATLEYISANHLRNTVDEIDVLLDSTMVHSFRYLSANVTSLRSTVDLPAMLTRLKGVYTSSRSTDPDLLALRQLCERVVKHAIHTSTPAVIAAVRTAVLLYLVARAYSMRHYTSGGA
jgi:hypothetical protein